MTATEERANVIEAVIRDTFAEGEIDCVRVVEARDHQDDRVLEITVVFDRKGGLDPHRTVTIARHIRNRLSHTSDDSAFPIVSFVSKSDAASLKPEAA